MTSGSGAGEPAGSGAGEPAGSGAGEPAGSETGEPAGHAAGRLRPSAPAAMLLVTALLWGIAGMFIKATPLAGPQLAFWRSLAGALTYQAILLVRGVRPSVSAIRRAALGGLGYGLGLSFQFIAFKSTTLVSANVIASFQPLILAFYAHYVDRDRLRRAAIGATLVAVAGTVVVVIGSRSHGAWSLHGDLAALAGMFVFCLYPVGTKRARSTMSPLEYQAAALWTAAVVTLPFAAVANRTIVLPSPQALAWIAGLVAVGGTGHLLFSAAQRHVSVAASSAIVLLEVLTVAVGGALFFHQPISAVQAAGMVIVAVGIGWWAANA